MSKFIKLLTSAYVNGDLRHPHEGVLHLDDGEAQRLLDNQAAEDVTADFTAADRKDVPIEGLTASPPSTPDLPSVDHQATIPPTTPPASIGAASSKEKSK
jgi:hypothetical protein